MLLICEGKIHYWRENQVPFGGPRMLLIWHTILRKGGERTLEQTLEAIDSISFFSRDASKAEEIFRRNCLPAFSPSNVSFTCRQRRCLNPRLLKTHFKIQGEV
jgi:hypothetical protein